MTTQADCSAPSSETIPAETAAAEPAEAAEATSPPDAPAAADAAAAPQDVPTPPKVDHQPRPQPTAPPPSSDRSPASGGVGAFADYPLAMPRGNVGYLHRLTYVLAVAAAFGLAPLASKLGTTLSAAALVALGVALALAASGSMSATAILGGSAGALASGLATRISPAVAGGLLVALCFLERTGRVRGSSAKLVHVGLALAGGAIAGLVAASYEAAEPGVRAISIVVAAVLGALPLFVDADDPRAHALDELAEQVSEPARGLLRRGAALCRTADESILDRPLLGQVRRSWRKLLELGEARARLGRSYGSAALAAAAEGPGTRRYPLVGAQARAVARRLDQQIDEHVAVLTRAFTAFDAAQAAELSLDDGALSSVRTSGESLEQVAEAIVEEI